MARRGFVGQAAGQRAGSNLWATRRAKCNGSFVSFSQHQNIWRHNRRFWRQLLGQEVQNFLFLFFFLLLYFLLIGTQTLTLLCLVFYCCCNNMSIPLEGSIELWKSSSFWRGTRVLCVYLSSSFNPETQPNCWDSESEALLLILKSCSLAVLGWLGFHSLITVF